MLLRVVFITSVLSLFVTGNKNNHQTKETHDGSFNVRRFTIESNSKSHSPVLEDDSSPERITIVKKTRKIKDSELPGAFGADAGLSDLFEGSGVNSGSASGNDESETKQVNKVTSAADFGSNLEPTVGINPPVAFISIEGNHKGFKGRDKVVKETKKHKKKKNVKKHTTKKKEENENKDSNHQSDTDIISQIQDIAKQIDAVERKRKDKEKEKKLKQQEEQTYLNKNKSEGKKQVKLVIDKLKNDIDKYQADKEKSTKNSHGKKKSNSLLNDTDIKNKQVKNEESVKKQESVQSFKNELLKNEKNEHTVKNVQSFRSEHVVKNDVQINQNTRSEPLNSTSEQQTDKSGVSTVATHGEAGGPEGFECPWVCFWTCHSYCPKECCNNPFKCNTVCRTFCTPYCSDRCCAPGSRRLPKLALNFERTSAETGKKEQAVQVKPEAKIQQVKTQLDGQYEAIKQASAYATKLLGLPQSCPLFCSKVCAPGLCKSECCESTVLNKLGPGPLPPNPNVPAYNFPHLPPAAAYLPGHLSTDYLPGPPPVAYCPTPIDCPVGGIVDPDYCPPICRSSCIEQCPNECCPNYGSPQIQPRH